jgi:hypothetical protein
MIDLAGPAPEEMKPGELIELSGAMSGEDTSWKRSNQKKIVGIKGKFLTSNSNCRQFAFTWHAYRHTKQV